MKAIIGVCLAVIAVVLSGGRVHADYTYTFTDQSGNSGSAFNVGAGQTVTIDVYLTQNNSGTSNVLSSQGLNQAGVQMSVSNSSVATVSSVTPYLTSNTSAFSQNANIQNSSAFEGGNGSTGGGGSSGTLTVGQVLNAPVTTSSNSILLGSFTFTAQGTPGQSTLSFTTIPSNPGGENISGTGADLDPYITDTSISITVVAVPEPGPLLLGGLLSLGIVCACYLRRRPTALAA
jgi:hypothetical protein